MDNPKVREKLVNFILSKNGNVHNPKTVWIISYTNDGVLQKIEVGPGLEMQSANLNDAYELLRTFNHALLGVETLSVRVMSDSITIHFIKS